MLQSDQEVSAALNVYDDVLSLDDALITKTSTALCVQGTTVSPDGQLAGSANYYHLGLLHAAEPLHSLSSYHYGIGNYNAW